MEEFQWRLQGTLEEYGPVSAEEELSYGEFIMRKLWQEALEIVQRRNGENLPSEEQWLTNCEAIRKSLLGEQPIPEWVKHLEFLVQREMLLDGLYQALWWYAVQRDI
ncbi:Hypothetical predicted protein [Pelobates cultripes]|uniref:Uncharacterized protein n=1 Tax=Pelobates cultripes TaxID=61616 RepID=A0AAD1RQP9_PELCU|nr:Hypothetical predicted protein [Pelobates cultripes]